MYIIHRKKVTTLEWRISTAVNQNDKMRVKRSWLSSSPQSEIRYSQDMIKDIFSHNKLHSSPFFSTLCRQSIKKHLTSFFKSVIYVSFLVIGQQGALTSPALALQAVMTSSSWCQHIWRVSPKTRLKTRCVACRVDSSCVEVSHETNHKWSL